MVWVDPHDHVKFVIFKAVGIKYQSRILRWTFMGPGIIILIIFHSLEICREWCGIYLVNSTHWLRLKPSVRWLWILVLFLLFPSLGLCPLLPYLCCVVSMKSPSKCRQHLRRNPESSSPNISLLTNRKIPGD